MSAVLIRCRCFQLPKFDWVQPRAAESLVATFAELLVLFIATLDPVHRGAGVNCAGS